MGFRLSTAKIYKIGKTIVPLSIVVKVLMICTRCLEVFPSTWQASRAQVRCTMYPPGPGGRPRQSRCFTNICQIGKWSINICSCFPINWNSAVSVPYQQQHRSAQKCNHSLYKNQRIIHKLSLFLVKVIFGTPRNGWWFHRYAMAPPTN